MEPKFSELSEFGEFDKSLKHELESVLRSCLSPVSYWHCGSILVCYTRDIGSNPFNDKYFL